MAIGDDIPKLLADAREGCPKSLGKVFESMRSRLLLLARRELPEAVQAKVGPSDLVQETAIDMQQHFRQFRGNTAEECFAWLRTVLRNNVVDAIRRYELSQKRDSAREVRIADRSGYGVKDPLPVSTRLPDGSAIRREDMAAVSRALAMLSPDHRELLELRYWQGLSFADIGTRLNRSPDAVRKMWYRAVENLEAALVTGREGVPPPKAGDRPRC